MGVSVVHLEAMMFLEPVLPPRSLRLKNLGGRVGLHQGNTFKILPQIHVLRILLLLFFTCLLHREINGSSCITDSDFRRELAAGWEPGIRLVDVLLDIFFVAF